MKKILSLILGGVMVVLGGHQIYLAGLSSYAPELASSKGLLITQGFTDVDGDGVDDISDNCIGVYNPTQADSNNNGFGDACDNGSTGGGSNSSPCGPGGDTDGDSVCDVVDNCIGVYNPNQADSNGNGAGDACDTPVVPATNGHCGWSLGSCNSGTVTNVSDTACGQADTWSCTGSNGGTSDYCSVQDPCPGTDGVCGGSFASCNAGSVTNIQDTSCGTNDTWTCAGNNGGSSAYCSSQDPCQATNGTCGTGYGVCVTGQAGNRNDSACGQADTWTCAGSNGGNTDSCSAPDICAGVDGLCGWTFGSCSTGYANNVNDTSCGSDDTWTCVGSDGGNTDHCSIEEICPVAPVYPTNGVCGSGFASCAKGSVGNKQNTACGQVDTWTCSGSNGGSLASCSVQDTCPYVPPVVVPQPVPTPQPVTVPTTQPTPIPGICGVDFGDCDGGNVGNKKDTSCGSDDTWTCSGMNGGATDYCVNIDVCTDPCERKGGDSDNDGVCDFDDNCPEIRNADQDDDNGYSDNSGQGDACENIPVCNNLGGDSDDDSVCDLDDNCPYAYNPNQKDSFGDIRGDACEDKEIIVDCVSGDTRSCTGSNKGICNPGFQRCIQGFRSESCEDVVRPRTEVCDSLDNDCDGAVDEGGICEPLCTPNAEVCDGLDNDCDGRVDEGNVCEPVCTPRAEVCDGVDNDCDGSVDEGNVCDPCEGQGRDIDNDGVCGNYDNCPNIYNPDQDDSNGYLDYRGSGDACEIIPSTPIRHVSQNPILCQDSDNDGLCDDEDSCPSQYGLINNYGCPGGGFNYYNPIDSGCSRQGGDTDADGICDFSDICPTISGTIINGGCEGDNFCPYGYQDDGNGGCGTWWNTGGINPSLGGGGTTKSGYECKAGTAPNGYGGCTKLDDAFRGSASDNMNSHGVAYAYDSSYAASSIKTASVSSNTTRSGNTCASGTTPNGYGGCSKSPYQSSTSTNSAYAKIQYANSLPSHNILADGKRNPTGTSDSTNTGYNCKAGTSPNGFGGCSLDQQYQKFDSSGQTPYRWNGGLGGTNSYVKFDSSGQTPYRWNGS